MTPSIPGIGMGGRGEGGLLLQWNVRGMGDGDEVECKGGR